MKIRVTGIEKQAFHGVYDEERKIGTQFVVNVSAEIFPQDISDDLSHTLDYQHMYNIALQKLSEPVNLLETLVKDIAEAILALSPMISQVTVEVIKKRPLYMEHCQQTSVEATFQR